MFKLVCLVYIQFFIEYSLQERIQCFSDREECIEELEFLGIDDGIIDYERVTCYKDSNGTSRFCAEKVGKELVTV